MKIAAIALTALLIPAVLPAQTTQRLTAAKSNEYGVVYSLPLTAVDVNLNAEITEETPGEFYNYARRYLGITDAVTEAKRTVELTEARVSTHGVPDAQNRWLVQFKNGSNPFMVLTADGIPLSVNTEAEAQPVTTSTWGITPLRGDNTEALARAARQAVTAEMARSSSVAKRAELAAQRIFELREMRSDLLSGQAENMPADGAALELALRTLQEQEDALTAMFSGTRRVYSATAAVSVTPDSTSFDAPAAVIARLNNQTGFTAPDDLSGAPVSMELRLVESGKLPVNERGEPKSFPRGGLAYTIPGTADVIIKFNGTEVGRTRLTLSQIGAVFGLNPALFSDKREPSMATFDPATGALLELAPVTR